MDAIITILIITALAAISNWINQRRQSQEEGDAWGEPPQTRPPGEDVGPPAPPRPANRLDWEEELRRLLRGEPSQEQAPPPPPLVMRPQQAPPLPAPGQRMPTMEPPQRVPGQKPPRPSARQPVPSPIDSKKESVSPAAVATQAAERYKAAQSQMASRVQELGEKTEIKPVQVRRVVQVTKAHTRSPEVEGAIAMLQDKQRIRQGIIASVVLGPPKALEEPASF